MTVHCHIVRESPLMLEDMRPRCCKRATGDNPICEECAEINDGYQSCLGIGPEERARRARELVVWKAP